MYYLEYEQHLDRQLRPGQIQLNEPVKRCLESAQRQELAMLKGYSD